MGIFICQYSILAYSVNFCNLPRWRCFIKHSFRFSGFTLGGLWILKEVKNFEMLTICFSVFVITETKEIHKKLKIPSKLIWPSPSVSASLIISSISSFVICSPIFDITCRWKSNEGICQWNLCDKWTVYFDLCCWRNFIHFNKSCCTFEFLIPVADPGNTPPTDLQILDPSGKQF